MAIAVPNLAKSVPQDQAALMVAAIAIQVMDFATLWGGLAVDVHVARTQSLGTPEPGAYNVLLLDDADQTGDLGWHSESIAKVFAKPVVANGGSFVDGPGISVSSVLSHEVLETLADWTANRWVDRWDGTLVALEVCLAGDTKVVLNDGTTPSIATLAERGGEFSIWSVTEHGTVVAGRARNARWTGHKPTRRITLDDGSVICATPEHRFMLRSGEYKQAQWLCYGDELFAEMAPRLSAANTKDRAARDAESLGQRCSPLSAIHGIPRLLLGKFGLSRAFAELPPIAVHAMFSRRVQHVLLVRSKEQMSWIDTWRRVARVTHKQVADRAFMHLKGDAMGIFRTPASSELTITHRRSGPRPQPTRGGLLNFHPEPLILSRDSGVISRETGIQATMATQAHEMRAAQLFSPQRTGASRYQASGHARSVLKNEDGGKRDVYDLTVDKYHNFQVVGGIFVHNCDPVQGITYPVSVNGQSVAVSNFVLPSWFDPNGKPPFDKCATLTAPFQIAKGGYCLTRTGASAATETWGEVPPPAWRIAMQASNTASRMARRKR